MTDIKLPRNSQTPNHRRANLVQTTIRTVGDWTAAFAAARTRRRLRRETVRELQSLSNRTLRDIGIPRSAIWSVADDLVNAVTGTGDDDHRHPHRARPTAAAVSQTRARPGNHFATTMTAGCG